MLIVASKYRINFRNVVRRSDLNMKCECVHKDGHFTGRLHHRSPPGHRQNKAVLPRQTEEKQQEANGAVTEVQRGPTSENTCAGWEAKVLFLPKSSQRFLPFLPGSRLKIRRLGHKHRAGLVEAPAPLREREGRHGETWMIVTYNQIPSDRPDPPHLAPDVVPFACRGYYPPPRLT